MSTTSRTAATRTVNRLALSAGLAAISVLGVGTAGAAAAPAPTGPVATGVFYHRLLGISRFRASADGTQVTVHGRYALLAPNSSYFTVIYANAVCDPAQAFPVGPFTTDSRGIGRLDTTVPTKIPGLVAGTRSVSVRIGDTAADLDGDGKTGPTDVVAVPGQPSIGLVECDSVPTVR